MRSDIQPFGRHGDRLSRVAPRCGEFLVDTQEPWLRTRLSQKRVGFLGRVADRQALPRGRP